jgi:plasmid stabilization system protein ParE
LPDVLYLPRALDDLNAIAEYFENLDADVAIRVRADIKRAIGLLQENPFSGRAVGRSGLRRKLTHRYRFKIAYRVRRDVIEILGIYRFQNRTA